MENIQCELNVPNHNIKLLARDGNCYTFSYDNDKVTEDMIKCCIIVTLSCYIKKINSKDYVDIDFMLKQFDNNMIAGKRRLCC